MKKTNDNAQEPSRDDVQVLYDGECPVCTMYCKHTRLKKAAGALRLIDAREPSALLDEVTARGLDIDQGMVVKIGDELYYGSDAIHILARLTSPSDFFNRLSVLIYGSKIGAKIAYPFSRAVRNGLLRALGIKYIENLKK